MSALLRALLRRVMEENESDTEAEAVAAGEGLDLEPMEGVGGDAGAESEEEEQFDIELPASHSYMGAGQPLGGRALLAGGWRGRVPLLLGGGALFPGELVPLLLLHAADVLLMRRALRRDKLFGLLATDENGTHVSGYGTLCEVFEARDESRGSRGGGLALKARAIYRFRLTARTCPVPIDLYSSAREEEIEVLDEPRRGDPLRAARLASLDARRSHADRNLPRQRRLRSLDAASTPWPLWVFDQFDAERLRDRLAAHFRTLNLEEKMPLEPVSLSFWASWNLPLSARRRLALLRAADALARLRLCCGAAAEAARAAAGGGRALLCGACRAPVSAADRAFAMSCDGVHSNYTNLGGYLHDVITVSECHGVTLSGLPSTEYSWFPGYSWTIALCAACARHVGWRFTALRRNLRPQQFYGLSRSYVEPADAPPADSDESPHSD